MEVLNIGADEVRAHLDTQDEGRQWPEPEDVPVALPPVRPLEKGMLPEPFRAWLWDIAERTQTPADFVAVGAITAAAGIIGRKLTIRPKREDDWQVVPNLWGMVIGRPGLLKTNALEEAVKPVKRLAREAHERHAASMDVELEAAAEKARKEELARAIKVVLKKDPHANLTELKKNFPSRQAQLPERRYIVNDSTVEKLGELLNQNPNGLILFRDELAGFLRTMERQGHENDRAFYCESWNGAGSYTYDRIGRGTLHIEAACISILGAIQPGPLSAYLQEAFSAGRDDGFIQRFQLAVYPDSPSGWTNVDRRPDVNARERAHEIFRKLDELNPIKFGGIRQDESSPPFLRFSPDAQETFNVWRAELEAKLQLRDDHPAIISHLAKYRSLMPSLALIFHLIDRVDTDSQAGPVSIAAVELATAWSDYLELHARRIYQIVAKNTQLAASLLALKIRADKLPDPFTARDVYRNAWSGLGETKEVYSALELLEDLYIVFREEIKKPLGGRPQTRFYINPRYRKSRRGHEYLNAAEETSRP
jgi:hypothetical protein